LWWGEEISDIRKRREKINAGVTESAEFAEKGKENPGAIVKKRGWGRCEVQRKDYRRGKRGRRGSGEIGDEGAIEKGFLATNSARNDGCLF
jgi:hypothetical protein